MCGLVFDYFALYTKKLMLMRTFFLLYLSFALPLFIDGCEEGRPGAASEAVATGEAENLAPEVVAGLPEEQAGIQQAALPLVDPTGETLGTRLNPPPGYRRVGAAAGSFGEWLRKLPVYAYTRQIHLFNGNLKGYQGGHVAVVNMDVGGRDLQQCADAAMRLRAEYLYHRGDYDAIGFNFTNGFYVGFDRWRKGERIQVKGNRTWWVQKAAANEDYSTFRKYMDMIFMYAGTLSLSRELPAVAWENMQVGDLLLQGGSPGHAVLVADMAVHEQTGERLFMVLQSYMPAQDIHVVKNLAEPELGPWHRPGAGGIIDLPEWRFTTADVRRWK